MSRSTLSYLLGTVLSLALVAGLFLTRPPSSPAPQPPMVRPPQASQPAAATADTGSEEPATGPAPSVGVPETLVQAEVATPRSVPTPTPPFDAGSLSAQLLRQDAVSEALLQRWKGDGGARPPWLAEALRAPDIRAALIALVLAADEPLWQLALGLLGKAPPYHESEGLSLLHGFEQAEGTRRRALLLELIRAGYEPVVGPVTRRLQDSYDADSLAEFRAILAVWSEHPDVWRSLRIAQADHPEDAALAAELTRLGNRPSAEDARAVWRGLLLSEHLVVRREAIRQHVWLSEELPLLEAAVLAHPEQLRSLPQLREMPALFEPAARESFFANLAAGLSDNFKAQQLLETARQAWKTED